MATLNELFTNIANAIRAKTGSTATIKAVDFPAAIAGISGGGGYSIPKDRLAKVTINVTEDVNNRLYGTFFDQDGNAISSGGEIVNGSTYYLDNTAYYVLESYPNGPYQWCDVTVTETPANDESYMGYVIGFGEILIYTFTGELTIQVEASVMWG